MDKLERFLVGAGGEYVKTTGFVEAFGGVRFLRGQKVAGGLPDFLLFEGVDAGRRVSLLVVPDGFDFDKDEGLAIAGDYVEFSAAVGVVACQNVVAFAHQVCGGLGFDKISFWTVVCFFRNHLLP